MPDPDPYARYNWTHLIKEALGGYHWPGVEALRRVVQALEASERSANQLGKRIWWLNLWLLVFTIVICGLTIVLLLVELGVMRRPHP